jgi:hypothetical protein
MHSSHPPYLLRTLPLFAWQIELIKLLITQFYSACCHFAFLRSKHSSQRPVFRHPQSLYPKSKQFCYHILKILYVPELIDS